MTLTDDELHKEWERQAIDETIREVQTLDPVRERFRYVSFYSKSKGRRKGKQRKRKIWQDIELVYTGSGYHLFDKIPFDVYATEIFPWHENPTEYLKERVRRL